MNSVNPYAATPLHVDHAGPIGSQYQPVELNVTQPIPGNHLPAVPFDGNNPPPPTKRSRTGATKMRPSKTSTTPR